MKRGKTTHLPPHRLRALALASPPGTQSPQPRRSAGRAPPPDSRLSAPEPGRMPVTRPAVALISSSYLLHIDHHQSLGPAAAQVVHAKCRDWLGFSFLLDLLLAPQMEQAEGRPWFWRRRFDGTLAQEISDISRPFLRARIDARRPGGAVAGGHGRPVLHHTG